MAKFTKEQIEEAKAEFFQDENMSIEWGMRPASGRNGPITVYNKVLPNEQNKTTNK